MSAIIIIGGGIGLAIGGSVGYILGAMTAAAPRSEHKFLPIFLGGAFIGAASGGGAGLLLESAFKTAKNPTTTIAEDVCGFSLGASDNVRLERDQNGKTVCIVTNAPAP